MISMGERPFHLLMGGLLLGSLVLDRLMTSLIPTWNPPAVSILTLVIGCVWVGLFSAYRLRTSDEKQRVMEDRIARLERRLNLLEAEVAERKRPLI